MAMPRPPVDYLDARRASKPASGGTNYRARERAIYAPDEPPVLGVKPDGTRELWSEYKAAEKKRARIKRRLS